MDNKYFQELPGYFSEEDLAAIRDFFYNTLFHIHILKSGTTAHKLNGGVFTNIKFELIQVPPAINIIKDKFKFLSNECVIVDMQPGAVSPVHIDYPEVRPSAINFPMAGCTEKSPTIFYGNLDDYPHYWFEKTHSFYLKDCAVPVEQARHTLLNNPTLLNTYAWHYIKNGSETRRLVFSWSAKPGITYREIVRELEQYRD